MCRNLKKLIDESGDIEFSIRGRMYTILTWTEEGINIGPQGEDEDSFFQTSDELLDGYLIDGVPLRMLADEVEITFAS